MTKRAGAVDVPYTLVRIRRRCWEAMGGVNNPDLILRTARRGPDRYYIKRPRAAQEARRHV
ncbi:hypothetical protein [Lysobacter enzymogenes]|uniref:hypothetical protein n=1 Tax=Lysobacter enzymogenes TaxID=69 RepID=UPI001AF44F60|nr:hypothetical protein [Lysobacter enzymogenes]QQQ03676.1 hypothetical protein JHW41_12370 [Lysobacter enzymogenes]